MNLLIRCIALLGLSYVFIGSSLSAGACENKLFSLNIEPTQTHRIKINDVLSDLASSCRITVLHTDSFSRSKLDEELSALYIKDFTLDELFELLLHEHDLFYDYDTKFMKFLAYTSNLRAKHLGLIFGDQGMFVRRDVLSKLNGFREIDIMEDFELSRRLIKNYKMNIKPIKNEQDYQESLSIIESLMNAKPNTTQMDKLEVLTTLVESYEEKHYKIDEPDPIKAIKLRMEQER